MIKQRFTSTDVHGGFPNIDSGKFLDAIGQKSKELGKAQSGTLTNTLTTFKYDGNGNFHEHISGMIDITSKLEDFGANISDRLLVQMALNSFLITLGN